MSGEFNIGLPAMVMKTGVTGLVNAGGLASWSSTARANLGLPASSPGWLSGNPASAAISATVTAIFDLGVDWQQYGLLQIAVKATQALTSISCYGADASDTNAAPLCATTGSALAMTLTAAGDAVATALPSGRYVRIVIVNGGTAQGATAAVRVTAHPA